MRRMILGIAAILLAGLVVWAFLPQPVEVEVATVARRDLQVTVEEEGVARIREVFTVSATIAGRLRRIDLHAGDRVTEGETVVAAIGPAAPALLDSRARSVAEATAAAAQAAAELARAQLSQAEATLEFLDAEANRATALFGRQAISQRTYDSAVLDQKTGRAAMQSAMANLRVADKELESALAVLRAADAPVAEACCFEILAPAGGQVLRVLTESEQVVQIGTPILEIGDPANLDIDVDLLSRDAVRTRPGAEAVITGWGGPPLPATVERVEPAAVTRVSALGIDEQRVKAVLRLSGPPEDFRQLGHGFRVIAHIALWRDADALTVPVGALFRDGSNWAVFVVRDGRARLQRLDLGERNEDLAQVLDGLAAGEEVILHPGDRVADGAAVAPLPAVGGATGAD